MSDSTPRIPRDLTLDERKAAHAAFEGRMFDPRWSQASKKVYDGLVLALVTVARQQVMEPVCAAPETDLATSPAVGLDEQAQEPVTHRQ